MKKLFLALIFGAFIFSTVNLAYSQETDPQTRVINGTIIDATAQTPELSTLNQAIQYLGYSQTLMGTGPYTVFAPSNDAFTSMDQTVLNGLMSNSNTDRVRSILGYHVVAGNYTAADLKDGMTLTTTTGQTLAVTSGISGIMVNGVPVTMSDIKTNNGTVHVISGVLMPTMTTDPGMINEGNMQDSTRNTNSNKKTDDTNPDPNRQMQR